MHQGRKMEEDRVLGDDGWRAWQMMKCDKESAIGRK